MKLPISTTDPTLDAIDKAIEDKQRTEKRRPYLGMSAIGHECERYLWYGFRWVGRSNKEARILKAAEDGHRTEDVVAERLRSVDGIELQTVDPVTGKQFEVSDFGGHFSGHFDGIITGILQAPTKRHLWENKTASMADGDEKKDKFKELRKLVAMNEKTSLFLWDMQYYSQQVIYMDYSGLDRSYMTVSTPGGRQTISARTSADPTHATKLKAKAERVIFTDDAPERCSENEKIPPCVWCDFKELCRGRAEAERNCRTCAHVSVERDGTWKCVRKDVTLSYDEQEAGCGDHRYNPSLVAGVVEDANAEENWIEYKMDDGRIWRDG